MRWSGIIAVEGEQSVDGRTIRAGGLEWPSYPLPLRRFVPMPERDYAEAEQIGTLDEVTRQEDGTILGRGSLLVGFEDALEVGTPLAITADSADFVQDDPQNDEAYGITMVTGRIVEVVLSERPAWTQCVVLEVTE